MDEVRASYDAQDKRLPTRVLTALFKAIHNLNKPADLQHRFNALSAFLRGDAVRKIENIIRSITIKYYRSINNERLRDLKQINVITGGNDIGKSNVIRALKLFFHGTNDLGRSIDFYEEFSHSRLQVVRQESVKGKQFIQIEIEFNCVGAFEKTLPDRFKVKKTWFKDTSIPPRIDNDLEKHLKEGRIQSTLTKAEGSLQRFLGSIVFTHVPAIKDRDFFSTVLDDLQGVIVGQRNNQGSNFDSELAAFNSELQKTALELRDEFERRTGISTKIALPTDYRELFRAFRVSTDGDLGDSVSLDSRGDGIRVRFLPTIMNYIAERSGKHHIWGFEEPENSMEYKRAFELAEAMTSTYSSNAQIFITTHSPAFINIRDSNQAVFLASRQGPDTHITRLTPSNIKDIQREDPDIIIANELGHIQLMDSLRNKLEERIKFTDALRIEAERTIKELREITKPVLLTEGRFDPFIITEAWKRLRSAPMPFSVKSCSVLSEQEGEAAGADQLASCLRSIMPDHPHVVVGLFDRDDSGLRAWKLDQNFQQDTRIPSLKRSANNRAFGMLLPVPSHEPKFELGISHCIEFLFPADALRKEVDGRCLELTPITITERLGSIEIGKKCGTEIWQMRFSGNKKHFALKVVPTLDDSHFSEFESIFQNMERIIAECEPPELATG